MASRRRYRTLTQSWHCSHSGRGKARGSKAEAGVGYG
jgi:hypothetical protein